jgi:hypothetical protein
MATNGPEKKPADYLTARVPACAAQGIAYATELETIAPADTTATLADMLQLCADEDLAAGISFDLQLDPAKAGLIAAELCTLCRFGQ